MQITCPNCGSIYELSEDSANSILEQLRRQGIEQEVSERMALLEESFNLKAKSLVQDALEKEHKKHEKEASELKSEKDRLDREVVFMRSRHELEIRQKELDLKERHDREISELKSGFELDLKAAQQERDYYKDLKSRMSTKMVGETLEQHCEMEFNKIRMAAFPRAEFGKDNTVSKESGSKGDYIFREYDDDGIEIVSIMFEMKNEMDETASKKTNEHFFKELDKDRREKKCEYAVLVSLLESDSELYNQGIVDVSYRYDKMYVIRPQFFIPIITLLRNAALSSHDSRRELVKIQNQNLDVAAFKENFDIFKKGFAYNYEQAGKRLNEAVSEIDKAIAKLEAVKAALTASDRQLSLAGKKADEVTIEKLCKNSPILAAEFEKL